MLGICQRNTLKRFLISLQFFILLQILILFYEMASETEKTQEKEYFNKLLGKQQSKRPNVENYLKLAETNYQQKIKTGSFQVKETSDVIETNKSKHSSKSAIQNMRYMKKSLQKNLKLIDSRIEQLTQPDKKSKKIDDQQRLKFVSQMTKQRRELEKKRQQKLKQIKSKEQQAIQKELQQQRKKDEQMRMKKKQQLMKRAQSLQIVRKNKKIQMQNHNKQLKAKMEQKILSERLLQKYKQRQQNILQQQKKKLAQIRSLHKPLQKSDFETHQQMIDKFKSERSRAVQKQQANRYLNNNSGKFYKSIWYKKSQQEPITFQDEKKTEQLQQIRQKKDKLKKYSEYVRQNFKPQIDDKKTKQLSQKNKSKLVQGPKTEDLRQLGLKYLKYSKQHIDPSKKGQQNEEQVKSVPKPKNYLQDLKKNSKGVKNPQQYLQQIKKNKNMSQKDKANKILQFIEAIERKAKQRQHKAKVNNVVIDQQLDNMYMQAIQMKLQMLGKQ